MHVRAARTLDEVDAGYDLASRIFGSSYTEMSSMHSRIRALEPLRSLEDVIVLVDGDDVLGMVRILDRALNVPGGALPAGGITTVCVAERARGERWGIGLMEAALARGVARGDACSVLFARRAVDGWYPRLGYVGIGAHLQLRLLGPAAAVPAVTTRSGVPVDPEVIGLLARAYDASYGGLFLSFLRTPAWWLHLAEHIALKRVELIVVEGGHGLAGYCVRSGGVVIEAAAIDAGREAVRDVAFSSGPLSLPVGHWLMKIARAHDHELSVRYSWSGGHMLRPLYAHELVPEPTTAAASRAPLSHDAARQLLLDLVGATDGSPRWPDAPAWSLVDEF